ncbi:MAG: Nitrate reductase gamma subunit [uncultured Thiotrichaceae bacterium]|uniref:Nitrate reductase gamma subunit n=1 Tax=uncultured Thiotrichaceae bacterium TaxID=298394 RepID=A0A6S6U3Q5_9GAMM|nr:MAG: Nitrate reductase gamma subunit [uncultured Thiotrichaceae bacterium]
MNSADFLLWVRGTGLQIATVIFVFGVVLRLFEILTLGHKKNLAVTRGSGFKEGFRNILTRSLPRDKNTLRRSMFTIVTGYVLHIGLFVVIFLLAPHISLFEGIFGFGWPSISTPIVDLFAVLTMIALLAILYHRLTNPVLKFLSTKQDYFVWALTFVPLITGYLSYHHLFLNYNWMLGIHILSVELLMIFLPFTKLSHAFTLFIARWYSGSMMGEKGVKS